MDTLIGVVILIIIFGAMVLGIWMNTSARIGFLNQLKDKKRMKKINIRINYMQIKR